MYGVRFFASCPISAGAAALRLAVFIMTEGGMVVTRDLSVAERCKVMRLHGISHDAFDRYTSNTPT